MTEVLIKEAEVDDWYFPFKGQFLSLVDETDEYYWVKVGKKRRAVDKEDAEVYE